MNHPEILLKCRFWLKLVWGRTWDSAFLTSLQVILIMLVQWSWALRALLWPSLLTTRAASNPPGMMYEQDVAWSLWRSKHHTFTPNSSQSWRLKHRMFAWGGLFDVSEGRELGRSHHFTWSWGNDLATKQQQPENRKAWVPLLWLQHRCLSWIPVGGAQRAETEAGALRGPPESLGWGMWRPQWLWTEPCGEVPIASLSLESMQTLLAGWPFLEHRERRLRLNFKIEVWCIFFPSTYLRRNYPPSTPPPHPLRFWICWAVYTILICGERSKWQLSV